MRDEADSAFANLEGLTPVRVWDGVVARVVESERVGFAVVELDPNSHVPEHSHENEQVGLLLRGSLEFRIGDETCSLAPGATWCVRANVPHEVKTGPEGAVVAEVFAPARTDWAELERLDSGTPRWP